MISNDTLSVIAILTSGASVDVQDVRAALEGNVGLTKVSSAGKAMVNMEERRYDVAVLEVSAGEQDVAIRIIKDIHEYCQGCRTVIVTASDAPEDIFAAMNAGADAYVLKENVPKALEIAVRSAKLGTVWLDPGIAKQVLMVMERDTDATSTRLLPTGLMRMPAMPDETDLLNQVAASSCTDGVCMVDPMFVRKLKRFAERAID